MNAPVTPSFQKITPDRLASLLAKAREARNLPSATPAAAQVPVAPIDIPAIPVGATGMSGNSITYNTKQQSFIDLATGGESCVLIGAAGTGKTTCSQGTISSLIQSGAAGLLDAPDHKYLPATGTPGIIVISFTRRAVNNIRKVMPANMKNNCITFHKLMEYEPVYYTVLDEKTGEERKTMKFEPTRNSVRKLPASIRTIFIEESSMFSVEYFNQLLEALDHEVQFIFLGDIQQLPPVFGSAILGYKMLELPVIELIQVYRQALESPIIRLAHRILSGNPIPATEYQEWNVPNKLTLHPWKKKISADLALLTAAKFFTGAIDQGIYSPDTDMILIPFNKSFGTDELNKHIANHIARREHKCVYEIIAGFNKLYLSVGDKVLYDKEDAVITGIVKNSTYLGKMPQPESETLDYWGHNSSVAKTTAQSNTDDIDFMLAQAAIATGDDEKVNVASHIVTVKMSDSGVEVALDAAGELNALLVGYCLTVHKSQGSEFRKVFFIIHQSHATMVQRELLYTAVTRAKEELYCIIEPDTFERGILNQRIKGNTLKEKSEYFKGKIERDSKESIR